MRQELEEFDTGPIIDIREPTPLYSISYPSQVICQHKQFVYKPFAYRFPFAAQSVKYLIASCKLFHHTNL